MSHSTTATSTHILTKYSKFYPISGSHTQSDSLTEWQHFANPVLRLALDVKKSSTGELESVRLRILWSMDTGNTGSNEIIFEDLDLLAFSTFPADGTQVRQSMQGPPLKAVYRDAVVGVRYLHPRVPSGDTVPVYRRFQVVFASSASATEFINSIRSVCPCRMNPVNKKALTIGRQQSMLPTVSQFSLTPTPLTTPLVSSAVSMTSSGALPSPWTRTPITNSQPALEREAIPGHTSERQSTELPAVPALHWQPLESSTLRPIVANDTSSFRASRDDTDRLVQTSSQTPSVNIYPSSISSSLPNSTPPSSSGNSDNSVMPPPPPRSITAIQYENAIATGSSTLLSAVQETTRLYDLTSDELETIVSQIICEEGFAQLVEKVDSLWRVKSLLKHPR